MLLLYIKGNCENYKKVDGIDYCPLMSRDDINIVSNWSFYRNKSNND